MFRTFVGALGALTIALGLAAGAVAAPASAVLPASAASTSAASTTPAAPATDAVDCSAITFAKGSPLDGSNYINATFIQNGVNFQMNAEINEVQAQDAAVDGPTHLYVLIHAPTGDVKYPLTVAERDSGVFTYHYSSYLQGAWTVHWIQYDGHNTHYLGDLECSAAPVTPAACIPNSAVSYTYDALTNSGVVTVPDVAGSTHLLCKPFWLTATSWKYTHAATWPQKLDVVQKSGQISAPGSYPYAAAVACGQGDIYASDVAQPEPTATLAGPHDPFPEHFLNEMGFTGPTPTWTQRDFSCANFATPGDPSHVNETCVAGAKVAGSITVGLETGLVYSIDGPGTANDVSPVTVKTTTGLPAGDYVVTVTAEPGFTLAGADSWPLTIKILPTICGQLVTHPLVTPVATSSPMTCSAAGSYTLVNNAGINWTLNGQPVNAGTYSVSSASTVTVSATPKSPDYGFEAGIPNPRVFTFTFTKPSAASCGGQLTTLAFTGVGSSLWLILAGGLVFVGIGGLLLGRRRWVSGD